MMPHFFRDMGQVKRINADAMTADQPRLKRQKIPFRFRRLQDVMGRQAEAGKDHRDFVDEGDIDVALGVFDDLGGLGCFDILGDERSALRYRAVQFREDIGGFRGLSGDHLGDFVDGVFPVTGVDAFRRIAEEEIFARHQPGRGFQFRPADIFGDARINGAFQHHHRTFFHRPADRPARAKNMAQVRPVFGIHRRRNGDDKKIGAVDNGGVRRYFKRRLRQDVRRDFAGAVNASVQFSDPGFGGVEAVHGKMPRQSQRQR